MTFIICFFFFSFSMCALRKPKWRARKFSYSSQSIEHSSSIGSPHTSGSISVSSKVPNDTTAFYEFSSSLSMFSSIGPITHRYISTARRKTVSLTRKQNLRNSGTTTHMANICFYFVSSTLHFLQANTHTDFALLPCIFLHGFFLNFFMSPPALRSSAQGLLVSSMHTIPFLFVLVHIVGKARFLIMRTAYVGWAWHG